MTYSEVKQKYNFNSYDEVCMIPVVCGKPNQPFCFESHLTEDANILDVKERLQESYLEFSMKTRKMMRKKGDFLDVYWEVDFNKHVKED